MPTLEEERDAEREDDDADTTVTPSNPAYETPVTAPRSFAPRQRNLEEDLARSTRRRIDIERSVSGGTMDEPSPEPAERDSQLLDVLRQTGATGPGMDMLERRSPAALASFVYRAYATQGTIVSSNLM